MAKCPDCEELPDPLPREGTLYVSCPLDHTASTLKSIFRDLGLELTERDEEILETDIGQSVFDELGGRLEEELGAEEQNDTRCMLLEPGREPGLSEFANMTSLRELIGQFQGTWLVDLLREQRFRNFFHPIVDARDTDRVYGYEALLRGVGTDGEIISPGELFPTAEKMNLMFNLDRDARIHAIESAVDHDIEANLFINFNPASIYDPTYCLQTTFEAIKNTSIRPSNVVFEVVESEDVMDRDKLVDIIEQYRDNGFKVALDDVGEGYSSLSMLNSLKPDFIKIDMNLVQGISDDSFKAGITGNLLEIADDLDIEVIAEGVENQADVEWFQERNTDYLQGFYFAEPDSPPPSVSATG